MYVFLLLISVIEQCFPQINTSNIRPNCSLRHDLNLDDNQMKLLSTRITDTFGIADVDLNQFETLERLCNYIENNT